MRLLLFGFFVLSLALSLALAPLSFADENETIINQTLPSGLITITSGLDRFNLGETIPLAFTLNLDMEAETLVRVVLACPGRELLYYVSPQRMERGMIYAIDAPPVRALDEGICVERISVESLDGNTLALHTSKEFIVSSLLNLSVTADKSQVEPGSFIKISGTVSRQHSPVDKATVAIEFQESQFTTQIEDSAFSFDLQVEGNSKSGVHPLIVKVNDSFGNSHAAGKDILVVQIPASLEPGISQAALKANEVLKVSPMVFDQAHDQVGSEVNITLVKGRFLLSDITLWKTSVVSGSAAEFLVNVSIKPDTYSLSVQSGSLLRESNITVVPTAEISSQIVGNAVIIKNIGNIPYNNKTTIYLDKGNGSIVLSKKVQLEVGEDVSFNLSEEVPPGNYTVVVTKEVIIEKIVEKLVEANAAQPSPAESPPAITVAEISGNDTAVLAAKAIEIPVDERNFFKKVFQGMGDFTGNVVGIGNNAIKSPATSIVLMVLILGGILAFIWRIELRAFSQKIKEKLQSMRKQQP
ncbi:hypothetical protein HYU13_00525 [Candidatus Woesearchaeota archaeon]|nr:hypothetical protein [Candidatus Woesearchaeota archaeon]